MYIPQLSQHASKCAPVARIYGLKLSLICRTSSSPNPSLSLKYPSAPPYRVSSPSIKSAMISARLPSISRTPGTFNPSCTVEPPSPPSSAIPAKPKIAAGSIFALNGSVPTRVRAYSSAMTGTGAPIRSKTRALITPVRSLPPAGRLVCKSLAKVPGRTHPCSGKERRGSCLRSSTPQTPSCNPSCTLPK